MVLKEEKRAVNYDSFLEQEAATSECLLALLMIINTLFLFHHELPEKLNFVTVATYHSVDFL